MRGRAAHFAAPERQPSYILYVIKSTRKLLVLALVLAASACGTEADMMGMGGMDLGTGGSAGTSPDALPAIDTLGSGGAGGSVAQATGGNSGTGGAVAQGTGGSAAGTGGAQATGGVSGTGGMVAQGTGGAGGETPPLLPVCPGQVTADPCGYVGAPVAGGYDFIPRWKDGREISICTVAGKVQSGCLSSRPADRINPGPERAYNLCVTNCNQGCYKKTGSVCSSDADCCSPLRCKPGTVGTNKTCQ